MESFLEWVCRPVGDLTVWEFFLLRTLPFWLAVSVGGAALWARVMSKPPLTIVPRVNNPKRTRLITQVVNGRPTMYSPCVRVLQIEVHNKPLRVPL